MRFTKKALEWREIDSRWEDLRLGPNQSGFWKDPNLNTVHRERQAVPSEIYDTILRNSWNVDAKIEFQHLPKSHVRSFNSLQLSRDLGAL